MYTRLTADGLTFDVCDGKITAHVYGEENKYHIGDDVIIDVLAHAICERFMADNIEGLGLCNRTYRALRRAKINSIGELMDMSPDRLRSVHYVGKKSLAEISEKLADYKRDKYGQKKNKISAVFSLVKSIDFQSSKYAAVDAVLEVAEEMILVLLDKEKGASEETPG